MHSTDTSERQQDLAAVSVAGFAEQVGDLGAAGLLAAATEQLRLRRAGEVRELLAAAHWADLHAEPLACGGPDRTDRPRRDPMVSPGGRAPRPSGSTACPSWRWLATPTR